MPFNFGSFAGGLAGGLRQGQELKLRAEESKLKAKMFEHQMKAQEFDQEIKREKAIREQQDFLNLGRAAEEYGLATSGGRPAQEQIETEIGDVPMGLQVEGQPGAAVPGRPLSPSEIYTKAALRHGKFFQGPTGTTSGGVNRAFATPQEALAFKNTPEFQAAFPYGARLTQTHYGLTWQGILPINPASAEYHGTIAQGQPKAAAQQAQQEAIYGQSAAAREGALMAEAGAVMGQPRPRMGSVISPPPQPAPALAPMRYLDRMYLQAVALFILVIPVGHRYQPQQFLNNRFHCKQRRQKLRLAPKVNVKSRRKKNSKILPARNKS